MTLCCKRKCPSMAPHVIFLDIDGVLNGKPNYRLIRKKILELYPNLKPNELTRDQNDIATTYFFNKGALSNLGSLIRKIQEVAEVAIVITSTWRIGQTSEKLKNEIFAKHAFSQWII